MHRVSFFFFVCLILLFNAGKMGCSGDSDGTRRKLLSPSVGEVQNPINVFFLPGSSNSVSQTQQFWHQKGAGSLKKGWTPSFDRIHNPIFLDDSSVCYNCPDALEKNVPNKTFDVVVRDEAVEFTQPYELSNLRYRSLHVSFLGGNESNFRNHGKKLRIGVAERSPFKHFVEMNSDHKQITRFSIDVFEAAVETLSYKLSHELVPFHGSYDDLIKEVAQETFDAALGSIIISAEAYQHVEFSQPYYNIQLQMVVKAEVQKSQTWLFLRIFTPGLWFLIAAMSVFTGFVLWVIEQQNHNDNGDSARRQIGVVFIGRFFTLSCGQLEGAWSNLSYFVIAPWILLMLVVSSTYASSFNSIINKQSELSELDANLLWRTDAVVGCDGSSIIIQYLVKGLRIKPKNIISMANLDDYPNALSSGKVKAAFLVKPQAKALLTRYSTGFKSAGPTYELSSFGFMFPKGSPRAAEISAAILALRESGKFQLIEEKSLPNYHPFVSPSDSGKTRSLGPGPFLGLFIISGCASTIALLVTAVRRYRASIIQLWLMTRQSSMWVVTLVASLIPGTNMVELARTTSSSQTAV